MGECWMGKCTRWFPTGIDEIVFYLFYQGDFICLMIGAMDDETTWLVVDKDITILVENSTWIELFMDDSCDAFFLLPELQSLGRYIDI